MDEVGLDDVMGYLAHELKISVTKGPLPEDLGEFVPSFFRDFFLRDSIWK